MKIRIARPEDAGDILKIYAPFIENTAISFEYEVPGPDEFRKRVEDTLRKYPYLVAEVDGEIVGYAYASPFKARAAYIHSAEVSIYIDPKHHGAGIGRGLYSELEKLLLRQNVFLLYACITDSSREGDEYLTDDSIRFHTAMGYRLVGRHDGSGYKFGMWYNMIWMEKLLCDLPDHPDDFIPFDVINVWK